jgi:hypothetical protein
MVERPHCKGRAPDGLRFELCPGAGRPPWIACDAFEQTA